MTSIILFSNVFVIWSWAFKLKLDLNTHIFIVYFAVWYKKILSFLKVNFANSINEIIHLLGLIWTAHFLQLFCKYNCSFYAIILRVGWHVSAALFQCGHHSHTVTAHHDTKGSKGVSPSCCWHSWASCFSTLLWLFLHF